MFAVSTCGPIGCPASPPPLSSQNIQSNEKSFTGPRARGEAPTMRFVLGTNPEGKERVKGKASRISSNVCMYVCICGHAYSKNMDQPSKVANPARGQLNREDEISLSAFAPENLVSRDGFGSPVPRQPARLHTQAESSTYLRDSSRVPRRRPFIYFKPPYVIGPVSSLSGHVIAYRWRSLPIVRRHRASKPQGSSERVLPWQIIMDQLICASVSHTQLLV